MEQPVATPPLSEHEQWMQAANIDQSDWSSVDFIVSHESSWNPTALNSEGCVGLGQRCPASTLYTQCPDLDPVCQLRQFTNYAVTRYGDWANAASIWSVQRWW